MPIYSYECRKCSSSFQTLVRSNETPECPSCGSAELEQQLSLIATPAKGGDDMAPACSPGPGGGCAGCPGAAMMGMG
jgi:putative FmdB family regulatory protein